ncbi:type I-C CRISPR-associated protein Cas8c/Csd1 [Bacillus sp. Marseille-P3800]|uniref:type I-C CRISPR-associated protein Cas8c/Csd1 n=1 Tax=Bacillus sp. Marseille-P3800 TaxID=2014782 RepID=UPI000C07E876|nr:type I-C CRISPR-associated protein Cas8c/Csd1 [Bacillus sp. Marseille-P3800]
MSWLLNLYQTYKNNEDQVGQWEVDRYEKEYTLLPISHTTQNAHIEVTIDEDGDFLNAEVIPKVNTLIPCTEESASRTGAAVAPHPLHDNLSYVAGDFQKFAEKVNKADKIPYDSYIKNLKEWAESEFATEKVKAIYMYLQKGTLIEDLVEEGVLHLYKNKLVNKWDKTVEAELGPKPEIFTKGKTDQTSAFIRFDVFSPATSSEKIWRDKEMYNSFISFYNIQLDEEGICFITGKLAPLSEKHANKIRNAGDKAKLISANDTDGFTFRGRFSKSNEAATISYDVSQKAHHALKWLIQKQGKIIENRVFLVWGSDDKILPELGEDTHEIKRVNEQNNKISNTSTKEFFSEQVSLAISGYRHNFDYQVNVNFLTLDSATTGRMAVLNYRNMNKEKYLEHLENWHQSCAWEHHYKEAVKGKKISFYGAPATKDISIATYGSRASDKVLKGAMERLLPCIVDKRSIPKDIVKSAFKRASNPVAMEKWEWEKTLSITCALIRKMYIDHKEVWDVALNKETTDRSYLFGRLLAVADVFERGELNENRATNAIRYMNAFSKNPARTWLTIQQALQPYYVKKGKNIRYHLELIEEIMDKFSFEDFNDKPLEERYPLGYASQRRELYKKKTEEETEV